LCGNKCDFPEKSWDVDKNTAEEFALELKLPYIQTSAKERTNVELLFETLVRKMRRYYPNNEEEESDLTVGNKKKTKSKTCILF